MLSCHQKKILGLDHMRSSIDLGYIAHVYKLFIEKTIKDLITFVKGYWPFST